MHANVADTGEIVFLLLLPCFSSGPICAKMADFDATLPSEWTGNGICQLFYIQPVLPVFLLSFPNLCKPCKDLLGQFWQIIFALNLAE